MADIVVTYNTDDRKIKATIDGKAVKDLVEIEFYAYGEEGSVEIRTVKSDEEKKLYTVTKIMGNEQTTEDVVCPEDEEIKALSEVFLQRESV